MRPLGSKGDALREEPVAHDQHRVRSDVRISDETMSLAVMVNSGTVMIDATALSLMTRMVWLASKGIANAMA